MKRPLCTLVLICVCGCVPALAGNPQNNPPLRADAAPPVTPELGVIKRNLATLIDAGRLSDLRWRNFYDYRSQLREFYQPSDYALAWLDGNQPTAQALSMIQVLENAQKKGLRPDDYDASRWADRLARLGQATPQGTAEDSVRFDLALTVSTMRYISDLHNGRVNPKEFDFGLSVNRRKYKLAEFLRTQVLNARDVNAALEQVEPSLPAYRRTRTALEHYLELAGGGEGQPLLLQKKTVKPGESYAGVAQLAERLRRFGDLAADAVVPAESRVYEGVLVDAVKKFQQRHGLTPDGGLGRETFRQLSKPISQRVAQLQLALERWRWLPQDAQLPMVVVNIPEFRLSAYDDLQKPALSMRVIVGVADEDHKTPVFADRMSYIIFRPYWMVPDSIIQNEIIPALQSKADYLARHQYEMVDKQGQVIISDTIDADVLQKLGAGDLDVRQKPGPANSLGLVKFVFPNSFDVYLHGTPEHHLFSRSQRTFSHGCIRVEDPVALASWVLHDPSWTTDRILKAMNGKKDSYLVNLQKPIQVLILYATATVNEAGDVNFFDDVYKYDSDLSKALARGYPYPY